ncbi:MFS transporter [Gorillibacterium massiliense]|uniref:MFS transporter n=1 Tax=Gorillibacterium massiliense TaxID=1280390 RepID=UPI0004B32E04|nr:MFS transporter [Gorillibacterium massiliense]
MNTKSTGELSRAAESKQEQATIATTRADRVLFTVVTLLYWSSLYVYVPILSDYLTFRGMSLFLTGLVLGSYGFTQIVIRLPLGMASDRLRRRKPFIMLGMVTAALACLLFPIAGSWGWPLLARIVSGVSASTWVAFTVLYSSYYPQNESTKAMGYISVMTAAGQLVGMTLSGWTVSQFGYHTLYMSGAVIGLAGFVAATFVKEPKSGVARDPIRMKDLTAVVSSPTLITVALLSILAHSVLFITMFGFTPLQAKALGAGKMELTLLVVAFMVPHAIANLLSGRKIAPKLGTGATLLIGFIVSGICTLLIPVASSYGWLLLTQVFNGFAQGLHFPLLLGLCIRDIEPSKRATAMGFYQAVYSIGMFAGPFIAGWLNDDYGLASGFYLGGILAFAAAFFLLASRKRAKLF